MKNKFLTTVAIGILSTYVSMADSRTVDYSEYGSDLFDIGFPSWLENNGVTRSNGKIPLEKVLDILGKEEYGDATDYDRKMIIERAQDLSKLSDFEKKLQQGDMMQQYYTYISNAKKAVQDVDYIIYSRRFEFPFLENELNESYDFNTHRLYLSKVCNGKQEYFTFSENFDLRINGMIANLPTCRPYIEVPQDIARILFKSNSLSDYPSMIKYTFKINDKQIKKIISTHTFGEKNNSYYLKGELVGAVVEVMSSVKDRQREYEFPIHFN